MNSIETFRLAFKAILANKTRSILTMLGIMIGVLSVILLTSLVSGLKTSITSQIAGLGSNLIYVIPGKIGGGRGPGGTQVDKLTTKHSNALRIGLGTQASVCPAVQKISNIYYFNKSSKDATIIGVEANYPDIIQSVKITNGRFFNNSEAQSGQKVVVIGQTVVKNLFPSESAINHEIKVDNLKYKVIGVLAARGSVFGVDQDNTAIIPLSAAQRQFGITNLTSIFIDAKTPDNVDTIKKKVTAILSRSLSTDDFSVVDQAQTLSTINQVTGVLTLGLGGIAAISLLVGGIGIMNIMLVSVTERTREIGLRKALGARPKDIRNQFLIEAVTLSGLGGVIGIVLGVLISVAISPIIQTTITWWAIVLSFGFSMIVGIIFGVAPALRASRLNPIEALRYE